MNEKKLNYKNPIVFFNPKSAGDKTAKKYKQIATTLCNESFGFDNVTFVETIKDRDENNKNIAQYLQTEKYDLIITIGGDGTISSIVNAMYILDKKYHRPIMPIAFGSGNSVLREFNLLTIKDVLTNYKKLDNPKHFDLLLVHNENTNTDYYCINLIGMGFITDAAVEVLKFNKKFGAFSYVIGIFTAINKFISYNAKLILSDKQLQYSKAQFISVSNTKLSGGAIMVAPKAKYDDGLMDVVVLHDLSKCAFLRGFLKTFKGKHIKAKGCDYIQTDKIHIDATPMFHLMPDGEIEGTSPITISVIKSAVEMII